MIDYGDGDLLSIVCVYTKDYSTVKNVQFARVFNSSPE